jgi:glutathione S-transferase
VAGEWVAHHVSLVKKDHMTSAYSLIQPNLVVPALVHDGELYIESMEAIEYLDDSVGGTPVVPKRDTSMYTDAQALADFGESLHRSIRFVTFRSGLRGLARLSKKEQHQLKAFLKEGNDGEQLASFYEGYNTINSRRCVYGAPAEIQ